MELHGKNIIAGNVMAAGAETFQGLNPASSQGLEPLFYEATEVEIDDALRSAEEAFESYREQPAERIADFLTKIAGEIEALGDELIHRAVAETGLGADRLTGERGRTVNQLRMFAELIREGSWVEASVDLAQAERKPLPKPDIRRMLIPIGPVVVFGASNFPLAFSVAGGDTASALAARNPVIVKAHPSHPGTSELIARAVNRAVEVADMPRGVFSLLHGVNPRVSLDLVRHPSTKAVGFTGSQRAGRALFDAAAARPAPIPVYAEMGSINPVFVLPGTLEENLQTFAEGLKGSVTLGAGQFCTNPGLVVGLADTGMQGLIEKMNDLILETPPATMLNPGIRRGYEDGLRKLGSVGGVREHRSRVEPDQTKNQAGAVVFTTDANTFLRHEQLSDEVFGPSTLIVNCTSEHDLERVARRLEGHLTASIHGTPTDLERFRSLISLLEQKVGRLVFNGFPTGVEVCPSMQHGGPYPATTDVRSTSVGTAAIKRFARPVCYQNFPQQLLPVELQNANPRNIWRLVDSQWTKEAW